MTIDTKELRRLAQAATPGPDGVSLSWITLLQDFQQGANPAVINELLDRLEYVEKDITLKEVVIDSLGSTLNAVSNERDVLRDRLALESQENGALRDSVDRACEERDELRARVEAAEKERESWKGVAQQFGNDADELRTHLSFAKDELNRLRAKIEEMERQEPVTLDHLACVDNGVLRFMTGRKARAHDCELYAMPNGKAAPKLYAFPGAQTAPSVPEGWKLVPTAESRHPGIYKMLGALHTVDNTPGASEWESYAACLAAAPEAKP